MKYVETHHSHIQKNRFSSFTRFYTLPNYLPHRKCPKFPSLSSKRCNAPSFLLSILYKTSFPFHVFCFITYVINEFLVVLNIFHTSSKLKAAIFWFSKPFHYIFLLLFRQKAARSVREGFPQAKSGARRARRIPAGKRVSARCVKRTPAGKRGGARCARRDSAG